MEAALDIYIKLLVAIISFIAPLIIHLLSVFSNGVAIKKRRFEEFSHQSTELVKEKINTPGADIPDLLNKSAGELNKASEDQNEQLGLLDPKQQIKLIFPTFFYSLLAIIANRIIADSSVKVIVTPLINESILCVSLMISIFFAIRGIGRLKQITWAIIDVKKEIADYEEQERQQSKEEQVSNIKPQSTH